MAITIKNQIEIDKMKKAGKIVASLHEILAEKIKPGISTKELDNIAYDYILSQNAVPSFLGYNGFPASACISINEVVIHGIPGLRKLKEGDIVSIDLGAAFEGYHADAARTHPVGHISEVDKKLIEVTKQSFFAGISCAKAGNFLFDISERVGEYAERFGFSVVREFVGHGVGARLHEDPQIPNYKQNRRGPKLQPGMTLAIEPMVNLGVYGVTVLDDNWTVVTNDRKKSAHYENTVLITENEPEILTI